MIILRRVWRATIGGFWFVSSAVAVAYIALALLLVKVDRTLGQPSSLAFDGDAGAARDVLSVIAGSLITVAGLAFSLTIVVLILVSSQFSPRALPGFLADRFNQAVAGSFVGTFAYCLLVLRTVRGESVDRDEFVPGLSVAVGILLALIALALLLLFIHHMGRMIQASEISARIGTSTSDAIDRLYPDPYDPAQREDSRALVATWRHDGAPAVATAPGVGYVTEVSLEHLLDVLDRHHVRLHIGVGPGDFVTAAQPAIEVWSREPVGDVTLAQLADGIALANERHLANDGAYGARQLVDVALRALSPGVNDPTTADTCIGHLRDVLERLAGRALPAEVVRLQAEDAVVVRKQRTFDDWLRSSFGELARFAAANPRVVASVLDALGGIAVEAARVGADDRVRSVAATADHVAESALEVAGTDDDRRAVAGAAEAFRTSISLGR